MVIHDGNLHRWILVNPGESGCSSSPFTLCCFSSPLISLFPPWLAFNSSSLHSPLFFSFYRRSLLLPPWLAPPPPTTLHCFFCRSLFPFCGWHSFLSPLSIVIVRCSPPIFVPPSAAGSPSLHCFFPRRSLFLPPRLDPPVFIVFFPRRSLFLPPRLNPPLFIVSSSRLVQRGRLL